MQSSITTSLFGVCQPNSDASLFGVCLPNSESSQQLLQQHSQRSSSIEEMEHLLVRQMRNLSFQEKVKAEEDLHCVPDEIEETHDMVESRLREFESEVQSQRTFVYDIAERQNKEFVEDRDLRLMFLRCDSFNANAATRRLMKFLQQKLTYFGEEKLTKEIKWSDLDEDDIEVLESGRWHVQSENDRSGRPIAFILNHVRPDFKPENFVRASYFRFFQYILPNIEAQRKGIVGIYYDTLGKVQPTAFNVATKTWIFNLTLPVRYTAIHLCLKASKTPWYLNHVLKMLSRDVMARTRIHHGSDIEIQYDLRRYGIQLESFPVSLSGEVRYEILNKWLEKCPDYPNGSMTTSPNTSSDEARKPNVLTYSSSNDVLLGRGRAHQDHPGNLKLRSMVEDRIEEYYERTKTGRRQIAAEVASLFTTSGGRFLKLYDAIDLRWKEISYNESIKTIMQLFRSVKKSKLKKTH